MLKGARDVLWRTFGSHISQYCAILKEAKKHHTGESIFSSACSEYGQSGDQQSESVCYDGKCARKMLLKASVMSCTLLY